MPDDQALLSGILERLRHDTREVHERVLTLAGGLTEAQLRWRSGPHAPSIGFHVWHLARWAEHDAEEFAGTPQLWRTQGLAAAWGFANAGLGEDETGTEMGDDASDLLVFPSKAALLDYTRMALGKIDDVVDRLTLEAVVTPIPPERITNLFAYVTHDNRHLGMIEALIGVMGSSGTATR